MLNPDVTDPKVLASLRLAAVRFVVPESWRGTAYALGTAIPAGLNDAVALNGAFSEDDGALPELTTYLPADGEVEVWLKTLDAHPQGVLLGSIPVTAWGRDTEDDVLTITVKTEPTAEDAAASPHVTLSASLKPVK